MGVQALRRIRRQSTLQRAPLKLQCRPIPDDPYNKEDPDIRATHQELTQALKSVFEQAPVYLEQMRHVRTGDFQVPSLDTDTTQQRHHCHLLLHIVWVCASYVMPLNPARNHVYQTRNPQTPPEEQCATPGA